jgi:alpha-glucuronidase
MELSWQKLKPFVDKDRFVQVGMLLKMQEKEATWWRNACLLYFQTFSKQPIPSNYEQPGSSLEFYESLKFPFAPGGG